MPRPNVSAEIAAKIKANRGFRGGYKPSDLELARAIVTEVLEDYGADMHELEAARSEQGIYNDCAAVQAALTAIKLVRAGAI